MDAPLRLMFLCGALASLGANYETKNFVVSAPTPEFAQQVGEAAEIYRRELAIEWTGQEMLNWYRKCPILVQVGMIGAGGETTFNFEMNKETKETEVFGWKMRIQGSEERILDSVLPHEINHTIFACYFRRPLPRWADEGAASIIEHESERNRLRMLHSEVMGTTQKIPLRRLLEMREYPKGQQQVLTLYAEGHSLADYLIGRSGKETYLKFLNHAHHHGWDQALKTFYNYSQVEALEKEWDQWVVAGSPASVVNTGELLADHKDESPVIRGQSPDSIISLGEPTTVPLALYDEQPLRTSAAKSRSNLQRPLARIRHDSERNEPASRSTLHPEAE